MKKLLLFMFLPFSIFLIITEIIIRNGEKPLANGTNKYAIVLGAKVNDTTPSLSLQYRLDAAIEYLSLYPNTVLILSGGQGPDEAISEAKAMFQYLSDRGIAESQMICEDQSTSTYENFLFTKSLLKDGLQSVTIISNDYHVARAQRIAQRLGLQTDVFPSQTPNHVKLKFVNRERLALLKFFMTGK